MLSVKRCIIITYRHLPWLHQAQPQTMVLKGWILHHASSLPFSQPSQSAVTISNQYFHYIYMLQIFQTLIKNNLKLFFQLMHSRFKLYRQSHLTLVRRKMLITNLSEGVREVARALSTTSIGISVFLSKISRIEAAHIHSSSMFIWVQCCLQFPIWTSIQWYYKSSHSVQTKKKKKKLSVFKITTVINSYLIATYY